MKKYLDLIRERFTLEAYVFLSFRLMAVICALSVMCTAFGDAPFNVFVAAFVSGFFTIMLYKEGYDK